MIHHRVVAFFAAQLKDAQTLGAFVGWLGTLGSKSGVFV